VDRSRALPGHLLLRAERFGHSLPRELWAVSVEALTKLARRSARVLRVQVEVFSPEADTRQGLAAHLRACGFRPAHEHRSYANTLTIDLRPDEESILASFRPNTRRIIRSVGKHPVQLRPIDDSAWVGRMAALYRETMSRTGGAPQECNWAGRIELSRQVPEQSRVVGLFRTDQDGPESLLAFAWACAHGDHVCYHAAASTRQADLKISLAYPVVWDLVCWARRHGALWFDFGGITMGSLDSEDRLGGISDFKRHFSKTVATVGEEWLLEPHRSQAQLARLVRAGADWVSHLRSAFRSYARV
jgi:hypothetical protein